MLLLRGATARSSPAPLPAHTFQYMLLLRGATAVAAWADWCREFQYMLLLRGATAILFHQSARNCFNTCSSCEEQLGAHRIKRIRYSFNTCSSCEEQRTSLNFLKFCLLFQYMLLLRGATDDTDKKFNDMPFQYMLLLRGATGDRKHQHGEREFQYMLLLRGATEGRGNVRNLLVVSIHAPLARSNVNHPAHYAPIFVSIHAPLARSNGLMIRKGARPQVSIHAPLARSNIAALTKELNKLVSIHAPLARSNKTRVLQRWPQVCFNTCSSCEEQLEPQVPGPVDDYVSIHAPLARSNRRRSGWLKQCTVSIHAPLARSNRGNINRSGSKCKSKNRAKYQLSFVKEHYCILRFLIIV